MNRVLQQYKDEVVAKLTEQFGYTTVMQVPKIDKLLSIWALVMLSATLNY